MRDSDSQYVLSVRFRYVCALLAAGLLVLTDQLTKHLAVQSLSGGKVVSVVPGVLELTLVYNTGAAFGMGQGGQRLFIVLALLIGAFLVIWLYRSLKSGGGPVMNAALIMVLAGAVGNAFDRVRVQYVIDFIYVKLIDFPVFNVADICVTAGCILLMIGLFTREKT